MIFKHPAVKDGAIKVAGEMIDIVDHAFEVVEQDAVSELQALGFSQHENPVKLIEQKADKAENTVDEFESDLPDGVTKKGAWFTIDLPGMDKPEKAQGAEAAFERYMELTKG